MRLKTCFFNYLIGYFLLIGLAFADPVPAVPDTTSMPKIWDNLNGTAGEPLSLHDIYLVEPKNSRLAVQYDPINTKSYFDSLGRKQTPKSYNRRLIYVYQYSRTNLPISYSYGISRLFEIEIRRAFITRRNVKTYNPLPESLLVQPALIQDEIQGFGDLSIRIRTRIIGERDRPIYLAFGTGLKLPISSELSNTQNLPINPGSIDLFFGIYNVLKIGRIIFPSAVTYSHTGRYLNSLPMGEIITYQIGLIAPILSLVDFNLSLRGFGITDESKPSNTSVNPNLSSSIIDKITEITPQGISQTSAEVGLSLKIPKVPIILSGGILSDLRGKRTFQEDIAATFSLQVGF